MAGFVGSINLPLSTTIFSDALQLSKLDFTSADEKKLIEQVFVNAIDSLNDDDKKLPQVNSVRQIFAIADLSSQIHMYARASD